MLFPNQATTQARDQALELFDAGGLTESALCERLIELDPHDHIALGRYAQMLEEAGDLTGAEHYMWRAVDAQPCSGAAYLALASLLRHRSEALAHGLFELAFAKLLLLDEADKLEDADALGGDVLGGLPASARVELALAALREQRVAEPPEVIARLRPYRALHRLQEARHLTPAQVDALLAEGAALPPLLVGVLRAWVEDVLPEEHSDLVASALALLGELRDLQTLPDVIEMATADHHGLASAARWAFDRMIVCEGPRVGAALEPHADAFDCGSRLVIVDRLLRYPEMDAAENLGRALGAGLVKLTQKQCAFLYSALLPVLASRGPLGVETARELLRDNAAFIPAEIRTSCGAFIDQISAKPRVRKTRPQPQHTVYDICAGSVS